MVNNWISVEDRLPKDDESVLIIQSGNDVCSSLIIQASIFQGDFFPDHLNGIIDYHDCIITTHWMPLPEPPKE